MKTIIYNARLVDAKIDSEGMVVCDGGKISLVFLGKIADRTLAETIFRASFCGNSGKTDFPGDVEFFDAGGKILMPSFIDTHAHFRYPGQTQKEDLDSALNAAVRGGFGTLVLMPNTTPVVSSVEMARKIMEEASQRHLARVFQTVSITRDFNGSDTSHLDSLEKSEIPVISEDGHDVLSTSVMLEGMRKAAKGGAIVACHCEDVDLALAARPFRQEALKIMRENSIPAGDFSFDIGSVPTNVSGKIYINLKKANDLLALAEDTATERNIALAEAAGCKIHICHCSTERSMDSVRRAKERGARCTVEVTPHHLFLSGDKFPNIRALVNPPLRPESDRWALISALRDGTADCIGTDHAPHTMEDKAAGSPGFTGLETAFAACHTALCCHEGFTLSRLSELMSANPAKILGISSGRILAGMDANLVVVDETEQWKVEPEKFASKGKSTPLSGMTLTGRVKATFFEGRRVF